MNPYSGIEKRLESVASAVESLDKTNNIATRERLRERKRIPFDVDSLTSEEVNSLKRLIEHEKDIFTFSRSQIELGGDTVRGLYAEFNRLNLVIQEIGGGCAAVLPMAHWAVEKYEQRERDASKNKTEQWRHDILVASISTAVGGILGITGTLLGVMLG